MKKKAKILATLGSLCIAIAIMVVGVLAATTAGFDVSSSVSFTSTGVFVKVQGDILKGATASSATKATAPDGSDYDYVGYSYNHANGSDEPNGTSLNPDQASYEMPAWTVGAVSFDEDNQTIVYSFKFSNYSAFPIIATITTNLDEFRTAYGDKLTITESATGSVSIAQGATNVKYSIALKLNDFSTSLTKALSISMTFAKDESTPASYMAPASLDGFEASVSGDTTTFTKGDETLTISTSTSGTTVTETATFTNKGLTTTYTTTYSTASTASASLNASTLSSGYVVKDRKLTKVTPPSGATELVIPDWLGITSIESYYIFGSSSLNKSSTISKITLPNGLTSLGTMAFYCCTALTSITLPDGLTSINGSNFYGCTSLTSINLPDGLLSIGTNAFYNCTSLTSITLPDGFTSIGESAFNGCTSLTSITLTDGLTSIGHYAFKGCTSLTSLTLPDSIEEVGLSAFDSSTIQAYGTPYNDFLFLGNEDNPYVLLCAPTSSKTTYTIPDGVKTIMGGAFKDDISLQNINIPDSVVSLPHSVFSGCTSLTSITLPDGLTSIGYEAFKGCTSLTSIDFPDGLTSIEKYAFYNCTSLTSIKIPDGVTSISYDAFGYCKSLTSITLPDGLTGIDEAAFERCTALTSIDLPDGLAYLRQNAFSGCTLLTSIKIPDGVTSIGWYTFYNCTSLTDVTLPDGLTSIRYSAFEGCTLLTSITLPDGLTSIEKYAFKGTGIKSVTIPASVTIIGGYSSKVSYPAFDSLTSATLKGPTGWTIFTAGSSDSYSASSSALSSTSTAATYLNKYALSKE